MVTQNIPQTLGEAACAVTNMSQEVASNFGPLMAALYNAYSQFNKLNLTLTFSSAMSSLGGAVLNGLGGAGSAAANFSGVNDLREAKGAQNALHEEFYGDYDPKKIGPEEQQTGKIRYLDDELKAKRGHAFTVGQNGENIVPRSVSEQDIENEKTRFEKDFKNRKDGISKDLNGKMRTKEGISMLSQGAGQIGKATGDSASQILQSDAQVVANTAKQFMDVLSAMLQTINAILNNNPNTAFVGFARG